MEGNFITSEAAMERELRSELGHAYEKCRPEASALGQCVETAHVNKVLTEGACKDQREALRLCVDKSWRARWPSNKLPK
jgi:gamma-glutamyl:cysteine ligase YbdK (ATP-grasp superfamily)